MRRSRPLVVGATIIVLAASMSACTPAASSPPTVAPTPSETLGPVVDRPEPVFGVACDELVDSRELQSFIGVGVSAISLIEPANRVLTVTPDEAARDQIGSLVCDWNDGQRATSPWGPPPDPRQSVRLSLVADAEEAAQRYVDTYASAENDTPYGPTAQGPRCIGIDDAMPSGYCELHGWLSNAWIDFTVSGLVTDGYASDAEVLDAFMMFTDEVVATLDDVETTEAWVPPVSPNPVSDCASVLTTDDVVELTGITNVFVGPSWDGPRIGQYWYATDTEQAMRCSFNFRDAEGWFGAAHVLPEGAWGFATAAPTWLADGGVASDVAGLEAGDAVMRCADPADTCTLDMRVAGHWIRVEVMPPPPADVGYVPAGIDFDAARAAVVPIAERIVANIMAD